MNRTERIQARQRHSYNDFYNNHTLFEKGSWLEKPSNAIQRYIPVIQKTPKSRVLDLGCGPGRHAIPVAKAIGSKGGQVVAVDQLPLAIEQLQHYSRQHGVEEIIQPVCTEVENVDIPAQSFDWVFAVSLLENVSSETALFQLLSRIEAGVISKRYVTFLIDTEVEERQAHTDEMIEPLLKWNATAAEVKKQLRQAFAAWRVVVETEETHRTVIKRESMAVEQSKKVVTFLAQKY